MRPPSNRRTQGKPEDASTILARRLERESRLRAERKRAAVLAISLASAGVLLLGAVGVALATRPGDAAADGVITAGQTELSTAAASSPSPALPDEAPIETTTDVAPAVAPDESPAVVAPEAKTAPNPSKKASGSTTVQRFTIDIGDAGYEPSVVNASAASPITLTVAKGEGCAAGFTIPSLGIQKDNSGGPVTFSLGRLKAGTYRFACAMDMVEGTIVVR